MQDRKEARTPTIRPEMQETPELFIVSCFYMSVRYVGHQYPKPKMALCAKHYKHHIHVAAAAVGKSGVSSGSEHGPGLHVVSGHPMCGPYKVLVKFTQFMI